MKFGVVADLAFAFDSGLDSKNMKEWEAHFTGKYGIVGELIDEDQA